MGVAMDGALPSRALKPVVAVGKSASVIDAVRAMVEHIVGAVVVLDDGRLAGVFTERDVVTRIVMKGLDPEKTCVAEVMTRNVATVRQTTDREEAMRIMVDKHIRHLPVVDAAGKVVAMLSMRHLLADNVEQ